MLRRCAFALLLLVTSLVHAEWTTEDPITVSWVPPTENTDGSALPRSELSHYTVYWSCDTGKIGTMRVDEPNTSASLTGRLVGNCEVEVDVTNVQGISSARSDIVPVLVRLPKPAYGGFR